MRRTKELKRLRLASRLSAALGTFAATALATTTADAYETEVEATTAAQSYALSSPWASNVVGRRRYLQTLALGLYHLEGERTRPGEPEVFLKLRMRIDVDFGMGASATTYTPGSDAFVPGLVQAPLDLMYGYVEGRNFARGAVGFRIGRQYVTGALGFWSFDGALVRLSIPALLTVEVYGGLEQRGGLPLSLPRYEQNGIFRGDRTGLERSVYPEFQSASVAPAYGIAAETSRLPWLRGRVDYRRVWNHGTSIVTELPDPVTRTFASIQDTRISSDKLGIAADADAGGIGAAKAGFVYDLYGASTTSAFGAIDAYLSDAFTVGVDVDYLRPSFDGDSIFNFFAHNPIRTLTGRAALRTGPFDWAASGGLRTFYTDGDRAGFDPAAAAPMSSPEDDALADLSGRCRAGSARFGFHGSMERGAHGRRQGGDLFGERTFLAGRYGAHARASLYDWYDPLRPDRSATSLGYVLGATFQPSETIRTLIEWEHDMNRLVGQRYRVLAVLELRVAR